MLLVQELIIVGTWISIFMEINFSLIVCQSRFHILSLLKSIFHIIVSLSLRYTVQLVLHYWHCPPRLWQLPPHCLCPHVLALVWVKAIIISVELCALLRPHLLVPHAQWCHQREEKLTLPQNRRMAKVTSDWRDWFTRTAANTIDYGSTTPCWLWTEAPFLPVACGSTEEETKPNLVR